MISVLHCREYFDPSTKNFGYNLLVANGTSDKPDFTPYKWFYGDVWGYFAHKHIVLDLYADYQTAKLDHHTGIIPARWLKDFWPGTVLQPIRV